MDRRQSRLFSKELHFLVCSLQKKPEAPPPSTNPFLEDETGTETDEIVIEKSDTDKVSLQSFPLVSESVSVSESLVVSKLFQ